MKSLVESLKVNESNETFWEYVAKTSKNISSKIAKSRGAKDDPADYAIVGWIADCITDDIDNGMSEDSWGDITDKSQLDDLIEEWKISLKDVALMEPDDIYDGAISSDFKKYKEEFSEEDVEDSIKQNFDSLFDLYIDEAKIRKYKFK